MKQNINAATSMNVGTRNAWRWCLGVAVILTAILALPLVTQAASKAEARCVAVQPCTAGCVCPSQF